MFYAFKGRYLAIVYILFLFSSITSKIIESLTLPLSVDSYIQLPTFNASILHKYVTIYLRKNNQATNVIIHGLMIHDCRAQTPGPVMGPDAKIVHLGEVDGDAIRMLTSSKIWIDHNTLYDCPDGLIDVTRGSTDITISNNWFRHQDKVMLLGHDDGFLRDKNMRVTVAFNNFGPGCRQRMPRYFTIYLKFKIIKAILTQYCTISFNCYII